MADELTAAFNLNVESNAKQIAAEGAEGLANLQERMQGSVAELRNLNGAMRSLKGAAGVSGAAVDELKAKIGAQKAAIAAQNQAFLKAGGTFKELGERNAARAAKEAAIARAKLDADKRQAKQAAVLKQETAAGAKEALALGGAIAATVIAAAAVAAAAGAAAVSLFKFGVAAADARRSEELQLEGLSKIRVGLYGMVGGFKVAADSGAFLQSALDQVSDNSAVGRGQLAAYEAQLYKTGFRAGNLQVALQAMATVASTQGEEQAQRFAGMAAGARYAGVSVKALADDVKARLGGIAARQMLSLTVQSQKLHESFSRLFSTLNLEPLLAGVKSVTDIFKISTVQGGALQLILADLFQPLIDSAPTAGEIVKNAITGMLLAVVTLQDYFVKAQIAWIELFGNSKAKSNIDLATIAAYAAGGAVAVLAGGFTALAIGAAALVAPFLLLQAGLYGVTYAAIAIDEKFKQWGLSWRNLGANLVTGLASGITGAVPALVVAVAQMGGAALDAFRKKFDMHSPSRVMRLDGRNIVRGQILGMRDERPQLEREVESSMVAPVTGRSGGAGGGARSAPSSITFSGPINIGNALSSGEVAEGLRRGVALLLSGALVQAGGAAA